MKNTNEMELIFDSLSANEGFARVAVAAFMTQLNPTVEEVADVKTAIYIEVEDRGRGIADVQKAMEPLFTTKPEMDRSGMGFSFMEAFMDHICVESVEGEGTTVRMQKTIGKGRKLWTTQSL